MKDITMKKTKPEEILDQMVRITKNISCIYVSILLIGMFLVLCVSIFLRFFWDQPVVWSNTITRYAYIHIVLLGTAISYMEGSHAQIDVFYHRAPKKMRIVFDLIHYGVMLFLCLVLTIVGAEHVATMWHVHSPILAGFPLGAVYLAVPLSAVVMMIYIFQQLAGITHRNEG